MRLSVRLLLVGVLLMLVVLPSWTSFLIRVYAWMIILGPQAAFAQLVNGLLGALGLGTPAALLGSLGSAVGATGAAVAGGATTRMRSAPAASSS